MLATFGRNYYSLRKVAEDERSSFAMNISSTFKESVRKYEKQLNQINQVTVYLQNEILSLSDCLLASEALLDAACISKNKSSSSLYQCKLKSNYISESSQLSKNQDFLQGILKIQLAKRLQ